MSSCSMQGMITDDYQLRDAAERLIKRGGFKADFGAAGTSETARRTAIRKYLGDRRASNTDLERLSRAFQVRWNLPASDSGNKVGETLRNLRLKPFVIGAPEWKPTEKKVEKTTGVGMSTTQPGPAASFSFQLHSQEMTQKVLNWCVRHNVSYDACYGLESTGDSSKWTISRVPDGLWQQLRGMLLEPGLMVSSLTQTVEAPAVEFVRMDYGAQKARTVSRLVSETPNLHQKVKLDLTYGEYLKALNAEKDQLRAYSITVHSAKGRSWEEVERDDHKRVMNYLIQAASPTGWIIGECAPELHYTGGMTHSAWLEDFQSEDRQKEHKELIQRIIEKHFPGNSANISQPTESESNMSITITHQVLINGTNAESFSDATLYELIRKEEVKIEELNKIKNKPQRLVDEIAERETGIKSLVDFMNSRPAKATAPAKSSPAPAEVPYKVAIKSAD